MAEGRPRIREGFDSDRAARRHGSFDAGNLVLQGRLGNRADLQFDGSGIVI